MKIGRRGALSLPALLLPGAAGAQAQTAGYPNRPVRIVVSFTAGGTTDVIARLIGSQLFRPLDQGGCPLVR